jgi:uncharacterized membrane protein
VAADSSLDAKQPASIVAGPYGHPFHPMLVTIPIGTWVASLLFDLASRKADNPDIYSRGAYWLLVIGIAGALAAAVLGLLDWMRIPNGTVAKRTGLLHLAINVSVVAALVVSVAIRYDGPWGETSTGLIALSVVALAALSVSGWLGGKLSYRYGVRVATEADQAEGFTSA